jgi:8-oxo-dGTP pyrophosphatase MutT (NUDIX family)
MQAIDNYLFEATKPKTGKEKVVKAIIKYTNKYLILRRASDTKAEGCWDLAGGYVGENEDPKEALIREVKEETGLDIKDIKLKNTSSFEVNGKKLHVAIYEVVSVTDNVYLNPSVDNREKFAWSHKPRPEHSEFKWIKYKDEIEELNMIDILKDSLNSKLKERDI